MELTTRLFEAGGGGNERGRGASSNGRMPKKKGHSTDIIKKRQNNKSSSALKTGRKRIGERLAKHARGTAQNYITRQEALKKLQTKLPDFRRLCIFKGIFPRVPRKKVKGNTKVYYHLKDIQFLLHEPLLEKFREERVHRRKVKRAINRYEKEKLERLEWQKPTYKLDHLIRERYPTFVDALRDLDDPLCLVALFATFPSGMDRIDATQVRMCRRLLLEFQTYCVRAGCLAKVFVSVKGIYYQAVVKGQKVTWIAPHEIGRQVATDEVDYRVMGTFLEFYMVLIRFVNFKLYASLGLRYPPQIDEQLENATAISAVAVRPEDDGGTKNAAEGQYIHKRGDRKEEGASKGETARRIKSLDVGSLLKKEAAALAKTTGSIDDEDAPGDDELGEIASGSDAGPPDGVDDEESVSGSDFDGNDSDMNIDDGFSEGEDSEVDNEEGSDVGSSEEEDMADIEERNLTTQFPPDIEGEAADLNANPDDSVTGPFKDFVIFLGRECPRDSMYFIIRSLGGTVCWDGEGSVFKRDSPRITHEIWDRPDPPTKRESNRTREYILPQWVYDSANYGEALPAHLYKPGKPLPPHLSPFVDDSAEGYIPAFRSYLKKLQTKNSLSKEDAVSRGRRKATAAIATDEVLRDEEIHQEELRKELSGIKYSDDLERRRFIREAAEEEAVDMDTSDDQDEASDGTSDGDASDPALASARQAAKNRKSLEVGNDEAKVMAKSLMPRKDRKLYEAMQHGIAKKADGVRKLEKKAKAIGKRDKRESVRRPF